MAYPSALSYPILFSFYFVEPHYNPFLLAVILVTHPRLAVLPHCFIGMVSVFYMSSKACCERIYTDKMYSQCFR